MWHRKTLTVHGSALMAAGMLFTVAMAEAPSTASTGSILLQDESEDWVTVEVEGRGDSVKSATQDAIANGLRRIVGEYVTADTRIIDDELVEDVIKSFTVGQQVMSERIGKPDFADNGDIVVNMRISAQPREINAKFEKAAASAVYMDGESLAAEIEFAANNIQKQQQILIDLTRDLPARLLVARLVDRNGNPLLDGRPEKEDIKQLDDGRCVIGLNIQLYFDLASWYQRVEPRLREALSAMSIRHVPGAVRVQYSPGAPQKFLPYPTFRMEGAVVDGVTNWIPPKIGEDVILLSRSRDRFGSSEVFDAYVIPEALDVLHVTPQAHPITLGVMSLDKNGGLIGRREYLVSTGILQGRQNLTDGAIPLAKTLSVAASPFAGTPSISFRAEEKCSTANGEKSNLQTATPRFGLSTYGGNRYSTAPGFRDAWVTDSILFRVEFEMPAGTLGSLSQFAFDPVSNPRAFWAGGSNNSPRTLGGENDR